MFKDVHFAFKKAHVVIWRQGCWKFLLIPVTLSFVLAVALIVICFMFSSELGELLHEQLEKHIQIADWLEPLFTFFAFALCLVIAYMLFRNLVMILYGPFMDRLSETSEKLITGETIDFKTSIIESILRPTVIAIFVIAATVFAFVTSFILGLIPIIGFILSGALMLFANLYLNSISYLDPYFERRNYKALKTSKLLWRNKGIVLYFGLIGFILTFIPIVGWFIGPTYSVVAGIVIAIRLYEKASITESGKLQ